MELDIYAPFMTFLKDDPDFNRADSRAALNELIQRETLIEGLIKGANDIDETFDCLAEQGIDPDDWLDATCQNIEFIIDSGIHFSSNDKGILLPAFYS